MWRVMSNKELSFPPVNPSELHKIQNMLGVEIL